MGSRPLSPDQTRPLDGRPVLLPFLTNWWKRKQLAACRDQFHLLLRELPGLLLRLPCDGQGGAQVKTENTRTCPSVYASLLNSNTVVTNRSYAINTGRRAVLHPIEACKEFEAHGQRVGRLLRDREKSPRYITYRKRDRPQGDGPAGMRGWLYSSVLL